MSGTQHADVKNIKNKMIFMLILCNVVQKRCSYVAVRFIQRGAGPIKCKIREKYMENPWIIV